MQQTLHNTHMAEVTLLYAFWKHASCDLYFATGTLQHTPVAPPLYAQSQNSKYNGVFSGYFCSY